MSEATETTSALLMLTCVPVNEYGMLPHECKLCKAMLPHGENVAFIGMGKYFNAEARKLCISYRIANGSAARAFWLRSDASLFRNR